jgi:hypothetical protein
LGSVRHLRHESGDSPGKLAVRVGPHRTFIDQVERGRRNVSLNIIWNINLEHRCRAPHRSRRTCAENGTIGAVVALSTLKQRFGWLRRR